MSNQPLYAQNKNEIVSAPSVYSCMFAFFQHQMWWWVDLHLVETPTTRNLFFLSLSSHPPLLTVLVPFFHCFASRSYYFPSQSCPPPPPPLHLPLRRPSIHLCLSSGSCPHLCISDPQSGADQVLPFNLPLPFRSKPPRIALQAVKDRWASQFHSADWEALTGAL